MDSDDDNTACTERYLDVVCFVSHIRIVCTRDVYVLGDKARASSWCAITGKVNEGLNEFFYRVYEMHGTV